MLENRNLKLDLVALALLAVTIFMVVSVATYDVADPVPTPLRPFDQLYQPDQLVHPANEQILNACGKWGAFAADMLFATAGVGAYYVLFSLAVLDFWLLQRRPIDSPTIRFIGWIASLVGFVTLSAMFFGDWSPGPVVGSGGYLGALVGALLETHFAHAGGLILCLSLVVGGLLLCTDYFLVHLAAKSAVATYLVASKGSRLYRVRRGGRRLADDDGELDDIDEDDLEQPGLRVRIAGRDLVDDGELDDDIDEEEDWEDDELEEELDDDDYDDEYDDDYDEGEAAADAGAADGADDEDADVDDATEDEQPVKLVVKHPAKKRRADQPQQPKPTTAKRPAKDSRSDRDELIETLNAVDEAEEMDEYELPSVDLLVEGDDVCFESQAKEVRRKAKILEKTFADFGFKVKVVEIETGPVIAQYEVQLEAGLRLSKITGLADDLAIALRVPSVRIVAPIPGKNTVGIEVPNAERQVVRLREVLEESRPKLDKMRIPLFLGKDVSGNPLVADLSTLPHLLIAGRTGTGKSVCLNAIISSILMTKRPDEVRMLMIDPKMVELSGYGRLPHLMHPVVTDMRKAEAILAWAVDKMEERYALLAKAGVRHISSYNQLSEEEIHKRLKPENQAEAKLIPTHLPFIVIVADEMADLMMTAGKEVEQHIIRLAQKSRAVGIHLILATQKPTVDVITGLIKSNLPARISFQVASRTDSRVVLDEMGADKLLGHGDMLFLWPGTSMLLRGQGTYLSDDEIDKVVDSVSTSEQNFVNELVNLKVEDDGESSGPGQLKNRDDVYEDAIDVIIREGRGSVSLLQRALGIGYGRAARLIDFMEEDGVVGPYAGSQAREVLVTADDWRRMKAGEGEEETSAEATPRSKTIRPDENGWDDEDDGDASEGAASTAVEEPGAEGPVEVATAEAADEDAYEVEYEDDEYEDDEYEEDEGEEDEEVEAEYDEDEYEDVEYEDVEYEDDEYEDDVVEEEAESDEYEDDEDDGDEYEEYDNDEGEYEASA